MKTTIIATLLMLVYIVAYEWLLHGFILAEQYHLTASLWRPEAEMQEKMGWMLGGQILIAVFLVQIFSILQSGFVRLGILLGALFGSGQLIMYCVAPYPLNLTFYWIAGGIVEYALAGLVYGLVASKFSREASVDSH